jgi:hypothetical protein
MTKTDPQKFIVLAWSHDGRTGSNVPAEIKADADYITGKYMDAADRAAKKAFSGNVPSNGGLCPSIACNGTTVRFDIDMDVHGNNATWAKAYDALDDSLRSITRIARFRAACIRVWQWARLNPERAQEIGMAGANDA